MGSETDQFLENGGLLGLAGANYCCNSASGPAFLNPDSQRGSREPCISLVGFVACQCLCVVSPSSRVGGKGGLVLIVLGWALGLIPLK